MALSDRLLGGAMLAIAAFVFGYYSLWALITPFFPADSPIQAYFPDRIWAVRGPAILLIVGLGGIGAFVGSVMQREAAKRRERDLQRRA
ncbi:Dolichol phosphate-mannose biosynthesis regulatory protein [Tilletia horrida]|uniref:Dolichol phosphate-mannose biosynthesis regulatory protein n=1 Tax=Tilletia horrida TaxID=155126 RepID=A0AAN6JSQ4_9BASI|nr:Dolichol phosphate-mannose biosynthesis regulatory protein [Tilletia horrida]KAK0529129.1 Dolichol phosphate-mannose biosynthesis regulatory protein [Tilletia horrida]KAK0536704.1 Dolichol phosphate-mannose biosynthesis regulatory protein [Tilletia horrida]KAK0558850.1 Dolichol phosphate-mannose biosynthesis regulatory protein [Tilletia horrida]